MQESAVKKYNF